MTTGIGAGTAAEVERILSAVDAELDRDFPGDRAGTQPAHTVYVNAADADVDTPHQWGAAAIDLLDAQYDWVAATTDEQTAHIVRDRLQRNPIEDIRLDLEDGYGWRGDEVEDADARRAGETIARWSAQSNGGDGYLPRSFGVRAKGLGAQERRRGLRTLELVLDAAGTVPPGFVFTVPKLRSADQVDAVVLLCAEFERVHGVTAGALKFELQIESPQAVMSANGRATVADAIHRGGQRLTGLHYGTYDYSAACGIVSAHQSLTHPVADYAKDVMTVAAAQTGVWVSDGSTQVMPVGDHARAALELHFTLVTRSLARGIYQGWDMHPGQLVTRWAATTHFFRAAMPSAVGRLASYFDRQAGAVVDEPATAQSLALVVLRGIAAGAVSEAEVTEISPQCSADRLRELRASGGVV